MSKVYFGMSKILTKDLSHLWRKKISMYVFDFSLKKKLKATKSFYNNKSKHRKVLFAV